MILAVLLHFTLPPASAGYIVSLLLCRVYVSVAHSWAADEKLFFCRLFETDRCEYIVEDLKKKKKSNMLFFGLQHDEAYS